MLIQAIFETDLPRFPVIFPKYPPRVCIACDLLIEHERVKAKYIQGSQSLLRMLRSFFIRRKNGFKLKHAWEKFIKTIFEVPKRP